MVTIKINKGMLLNYPNSSRQEVYDFLTAKGMTEVKTMPENNTQFQFV